MIKDSGVEKSDGNYFWFIIEMCTESHNIIKFKYICQYVDFEQELCSDIFEMLADSINSLYIRVDWEAYSKHIYLMIWFYMY